MQARVFLAGLAVMMLTAPAAAAPRTHVVMIDAMKFGAVPASIRVGDRIVWKNEDIFAHTATAADKSFDLGLPPGTNKSIVVARPGTIAVNCRYHPGMRTTLKISQ